MGISYNPSIVTDGLVLCLDAANRRSYPGAGTTWTDLSGNGNNGTLTNGPTFSAANGGNVVFDGSDDYVDCGNNSSLSLNGMTISAWIKAQSATSNYRFIVGDESLNGAPWNYRLYIKVSDGLLVYDMYNGSTIGSLTSTIAVNDNKWHYVCGTRTVVNGAINLYIDAQLNKSGTDSSNRSTLGNKVWVGRSPYSNGSYPFLGNISMAQIYNRALSPQEIRQNYNATKGRYL